MDDQAPSQFVLEALEYVVIRSGKGDADDIDSPAVYSPGLAGTIHEKAPASGCGLWLMEWSDGATVIMSLPAGETPDLAATYELTYASQLAVQMMKPANRLPV